MRPAVKVQVIGIASCAALAAALPFIWELWPLHLVYVDLFCRHGLSYFGAACAGIVPLVLAFEIAMALRRLSFLRCKPILGTLLAGMLSLGLLLSAFWLYPKLTGHFRAERALRQPSKVTITYVESGGFSGSRGLLVSTREDLKVHSRKDLCPYGDLCSENTRVMIVSEAKMAEVLQTLRDNRFFEMGCFLYLEGTIDGLWKALEVDVEGRRFVVHSYANTREGEEFDKLMELLRDSYGLGLLPQKRRYQAVSALKQLRAEEAGK